MPRGAQPGEQRRLGHRMPRKTCGNCGKTKAVSAFPKLGGPTYENLKPANPRRYDSQCKLCKKPAAPGQDRKALKEPVRKYTKKKKAKKPKQDQREYRKRIRAETRVKSMLYMSEKGCEECHERDPRKLEYDHKDPGIKDRAISRLITEGYSWSSDILRAEIRKCRILCASCHRKHTIAQQGYYANPEVRDTLEALAKTHGFEV